MGLNESVFSISLRMSPKKWLACQIQKIWAFQWKKGLGSHFYMVKWSSILSNNLNTQYRHKKTSLLAHLEQEGINITEDIFGFPTSKKLAINTIDTPILIEQCSNQTPPGVHRAVYRVVAVCDIDTRKVEVMPTTIWPLFRQDYNSHRGGQNNTCFDLVQDQIYLGSQLAQQLTSPNYAGELEGYYRIFQETQSSIPERLAWI